MTIAAQPEDTAEAGADLIHPVSPSAYDDAAQDSINNLGLSANSLQHASIARRRKRSVQCSAADVGSWMSETRPRRRSGDCVRHSDPHIWLRHRGLERSPPLVVPHGL